MDAIQVGKLSSGHMKYDFNRLKPVEGPALTLQTRPRKKVCVQILKNGDKLAENPLFGLRHCENCSRGKTDEKIILILQAIHFYRNL